MGHLDDGAFYGCSQLQKLVLPEGLTSVSDYLCAGCTALSSLSLPASLQRVGQYAFQECSSLTSIVIPEGVTSIGTSAFFMCAAMTSLSIPSTTAEIGLFAFSGCTALTSIESHITDPSDTEAFETEADAPIYTVATLYVPSGTKDRYKEHSQWRLFKNICEMGGDANTIVSLGTEAEPTEVRRFDVSGKQLSEPREGINIIEMSNGETRKVFVKE